MPLSDDEMKAAVDAMTLDRGFTVNAYAQVEYLLGRLIFEALRHKAYAHVETNLPFGIDNRVSLTRRLLNEGPLTSVGVELERVLGRVLEFEPVRHTFVHGYCTVHLTPGGDLAMRFDRFVQPVKGAGGKPTHNVAWYRPATLKAQKESAIRFVEEAFDAFDLAFKAMGVPGPREELDLTS